MNQIKIGMIGLDTSHVVAFTKLLNDAKNEHHVDGGEVVVAFPGGSADMELSYSRVDGFTKELHDNFNVEIVDSIEEVAEKCEAILLESVDGRVHLEQFRRIAPYGKPTFIDKPLATSVSDAKEIFHLSEHFNTPVISCSSLRYAEGLTNALKHLEGKEIIGVDCYGPLTIEPTHGLFWYGIHTVEIMYRVFGPGCDKVTAIKTEDHDLIVGEWPDGRIGTIRGNRKGDSQFGVLIHHEKGTEFVDVYQDKKPYYAALLEEIISFFRIKKSPIRSEETIEITRFLEAANESRLNGTTVKLFPLAKGVN